VLHSEKKSAKLIPEKAPYWVTVPFNFIVIFVFVWEPSRVPHPLAPGLGAGEAAIPQPPVSVAGLLPFLLSQSAASRLIDSVFMVLFLPRPTVVVRSA